MTERQFHSGDYGEPHDVARELLATVQTHSGLRPTLIKGAGESINDAAARLRTERMKRRQPNAPEGTTIYYSNLLGPAMQYQYLLFLVRNMFGKKQNSKK